MKIWKLSPLDLSSPGWRNSDYQGNAIVRAKDEEEARDIASNRLGRAALKVPGSETPLNPWNDSTVVKCIELNNSNYSTDGPTELLEPKGFAI